MMLRIKMIKLCSANQSTNKNDKIRFPTDLIRLTNHGFYFAPLGEFPKSSKLRAPPGLTLCYCSREEDKDVVVI